VGSAARFGVTGPTLGKPGEPAPGATKLRPLVLKAASSALASGAAVAAGKAVGGL